MFLSGRLVEPIKRSLNSKFKFRCQKGIACFSKCCSRADVLLTPYDIVRMKNSLGISSGEFLDRYTYTHIDEKSSHPYAVLKMLDDGGKCPFVTDKGCSIYEDRPSNCRYYPIGQGLMVMGSERGPVNEEFYFFINDPNCLGYQEEKEWTIETWRIDQGAAIYDEMNKEWKEIQLRRNASGQPQLDSKKQGVLYMASYDIDRFRKYVFESKFLDVLDIDKEEVKKIKTDEAALMKFAFKYLKYVLMLEETLKLKNNIKPEGENSSSGALKKL